VTKVRKWTRACRKYSKSTYYKLSWQPLAE